MEVRIIIPDDIAAHLKNGGDLSRRLLEFLAVDGIRSGELTAYQVQKMLGFESRFEVDSFLKEHGVFFDYSPEELEQEIETIQIVKDARAVQ
jgi:hypothetical protein